MTPTHPPHFQINISTKFVTAFASFFYCRLFFPPKSLTAFAFSSIADYFSAQIIDCIRFFLYCRLFFPPYLWLHSHFSSIADYFFRQIIDCIRFFLYCGLFFPPNLWLHSHFSSIADYFFRQIIDCIHIFLYCGLFSVALFHRLFLLSAYRQEKSRVWTGNTREACVMRCRLASATKPTVWAQASLGDWRITDVCIE